MKKKKTKNKNKKYIALLSLLPSGAHKLQG